MRKRVIPARMAQELEEDIRLVAHEQGRGVAVHVAVVTRREPDGTPVWSEEHPEETYWIGGDDYAELMAAAPAWAPNKPAGTWRREDLWRFIDKIRGAREKAAAEKAAARAKAGQEAGV